MLLRQPHPRYVRMASNETSIWLPTTGPHFRPLCMEIGCVGAEVVFDARLGRRLGYIGAAIVRTRLAENMCLYVTALMH